MGSAGWFAGAVVAALGIDAEGADDFAGGGVDDADVEVVDEHDDACSVEGSSEADVVELAVDAHADVAVVDAVVSDPELVVSGLIAGAGFGPGGVGDGWCRALWE